MEQHVVKKHAIHYVTVLGMDRALIKAAHVTLDILAQLAMCSVMPLRHALVMAYVILMVNVNVPVAILIMIVVRCHVIHYGTVLVKEPAVIKDVCVNLDTMAPIA
jgi:hypothetical protein